MPSERYYLSESLRPLDRKLLKGSEFHHLAHVMRTRQGGKVELVNGQGSLAQATVADLGRNQATLLLDSIKEIAKTPAKLILAQALPKPNRLEFVLEKGTELGVDEFWLFPGETSQKKEIYPQQIERAEAITIAAMKQCGRLFLPKVLIKPPLEEWTAFSSTAFFGDVAPSTPLLDDIVSTTELPIIFVTGPESGFTQNEIELLKNKGAKGVKLHQNILRTDTASLAAVTLLSMSLMRHSL